MSNTKLRSVTPTQEALLCEYSATQADYMHNDNFPWQIGSILIAGTFVFWGLMLDKRPSNLAYGLGALLVTVLLSIWIIYAHHFRQIYLCKLHRLHEIERMLGLESHRRWAEILHSDQKPLYLTYGPTGHDMNSCIYAVASLGSPLLGYFDIGLPLWWFGSSALTVLLVVGLINRSEKRLKNRLVEISELQKKETSANSE